MAAFRRRTAFAAPFVVTIAASCSREPARESPAQTRRTWSVQLRGTACEAVENTPGNPPAPQAVECPPGMAGGVVMQVEQEMGKAYCTSRGLVVACPLPYGERVKQPIDNIWLVEKDGPECHAEDYSKCPKGADCNPPKPRYFPCPAGVTEDHPLMLAELPDATCVRVPDGCDNTGCAREPVACLPAGVKP